MLWALRIFLLVGSAAMSYAAVESWRTKTSLAASLVSAMAATVIFVGCLAWIDAFDGRRKK